MKNKLCVIIPYFGTFPDTIDIFFRSVSFNPQIDWMFFTDCQYDNLPKNVKFIPTTLAELKQLIESKLNMSIVLEHAYKVCDYRPAFGIIFEDYINDYDFWGYGDIDLVYGDLSHFISDDMCEKYDKLYPCGHLSFVRNKKEINEIFKKEVKGTYNYKKVFTDNKSFIFDEYQGLNEKLAHFGYKIYSKFDFVDIDLIYNRFRRVDKKTINLVFKNYPFKHNLPKNHKNQIFYWNNGKTFLTYKTAYCNLQTTEVLYIHYRKKISFNNCSLCNNKYYITPSGFFESFEDSLPLSDIYKYNKYPGYLNELFAYLNAVKNNLITTLGKNKTLRNVIRTIKGKKHL